MTELIMNPKVMEKAQVEVRSIVGDRKVVLESDLPQMHYMKAVSITPKRIHERREHRWVRYSSQNSFSC